MAQLAIAPMVKISYYLVLGLTDDPFWVIEQVLLVPTPKAKPRSILRVHLVLSPRRPWMVAPVEVCLVISPSFLKAVAGLQGQGALRWTILLISIHRRRYLLRLLTSRLQRKVGLHLPRALQPRRDLLRSCLLASRLQRN